MAGTPAKTRVVLGAILAVIAAVVVSPSALGCDSTGYTYAGLASSSATHGVAATLTTISATAVADGHVAGWVGVGGPGQGPNGTDEWIQVGFSGFAGNPNSNLYYEVTLPSTKPQYVQVEHDLPPGATRRVAVLEVAGRPNEWRIWVDGRAVSDPIFLPKSHGVWRGVATAESWMSANGAACNGFGYRFEDIRVARQAGGGWATLSDALPIRTGVNKLLRSAGSFEAISGPVLLAAPTLTAGPIERTLTSAARVTTRALQ